MQAFKFLNTTGAPISFHPPVSVFFGNIEAADAEEMRPAGR